MKSSFCIDLQRFMLIPTKFPLSHFHPLDNAHAEHTKSTAHHMIVMSRYCL